MSEYQPIITSLMEGQKQLQELILEKVRTIEEMDAEP
jgi:hypothetical protein